MAIAQLHVCSFGGLHHEMYLPDTDSLFIREIPKSSKGLLQANAFFWAEHFQPARVLALAHTLMKCEGLADSKAAYWAIAANPSLFVDQVVEASQKICDQALGIREFYRYVETLQILCRLYSELVYAPHKLTLEEGFLVYEKSSLALFNTCLNPSINPYLKFILEHCTPVIEAVQPDMVWLNGRITISSMALSRLIKKSHPHTHISVVGHSSEYYSLNKIIKYLLRNEVLFSVIDSIVLDDADQSRDALLEAVAEGKDLSSVPNLLFARRSSGTVTVEQTHFKRFTSTEPLVEHLQFRPPSSHVPLRLCPSALVNVKLFPDHACYWNKCMFCGINQKYHGVGTGSENLDWDVGPALECFQTLQQRGVKYVWAIDEAIPPQTLRSLALGLLAQGNKIIWQARSRFDSALLEQKNTCELLASAGLKEIRFGLESASPRILKRMRKFPPGVFPNVVQETVKRFHECGVSVHCPIIIGYPTESESERTQTLKFLDNLCQKYSTFSFNINIFGFDIKSPLFSAWIEEGLTKLQLPCEGRYLLGNLVDWDCEAAPYHREILEQERNEVMHRLLYPWLPKDSETSPHVLYRLTETTRNTLTFRATYSSDVPDEITKRQASPTLISAGKPGFQKGDKSLLYDWRTHVRVYGDISASKNMEELKEAFSPEELNNVLNSTI